MRLIAMFLCLIGLLSCKETDVLTSPEGERLSMLILLYTQYQNYLKCQEPGAIRFDRCISQTSTEAIYDHGTGNPLHAVSVPAGTQLECRDPAKTGLEAGRGQSWFITKIPNPPPGYKATWIDDQGYTVDGAGNVTTLLPFTSYVAGDRVYCVINRNGDILYQAVDAL